MTVWTENANKEKIADVYIVSGQSNAVGCGIVPENAHFPSTDSVLFYGATDRTPGKPGDTNYQLAPVRNHLGASNQKSGFELGMATVLCELPRYKNGDATAIILKYAAGSTSLKECSELGSWQPPTLLKQEYPDRDYSLNGANYNDLEGYQYRILLEELTQGIHTIHEAGYKKVCIKGVFWMQGESDHHRAAQYQKELPIFTSNLRDDISRIMDCDYTKLPIYIGQISRTFCSAVDDVILERNKALLKAQELASAVIPYSYLVRLADIDINEKDIDGHNRTLGSDEFHWNYYQVQEVGKRFMTVFLKAEGA